MDQHFLMRLLDAVASQDRARPHVAQPCGEAVPSGEAPCAPPFAEPPRPTRND
jgi:hypothetical protein